MSELDQCLKSMYLVCDESVADDVNRIVRAAIAELEAENAKLRASASAWLKRENDKLKAQLATEVKDWAEADTHVRNVARPILGSWVDGDSDSVPAVGDIVEELAKRLSAANSAFSSAEDKVSDQFEEIERLVAENERLRNEYHRLFMVASPEQLTVSHNNRWVEEVSEAANKAFKLDGCCHWESVCNGILVMQAENERLRAVFTAMQVALVRLAGWTLANASSNKDLGTIIDGMRAAIDAAKEKS